MIAKYRNWGIVLSVLAFAMTVLFLVVLRKSTGVMGDDRWSDYLIPSYLCTAILWTVASYNLAKAKGYGADELGRVLMISLLIGFCCQPAALIFPLLGFFLKDKTQSRRHSHRRRRHS
jgi:hypothetical protein